MTIAEAIYVLCAVTSLLAAWLLFRQYRRGPHAFLYWSFIGFVGLGLNNVLVYVDLVVVPANDLALVRTSAGAVGLVALMYGLIRESRR